MATLEVLVKSMNEETFAEAQNNVEIMRNGDGIAKALHMIAYEDLN